MPTVHLRRFIYTALLAATCLTVLPVLAEGSANPTTSLEKPGADRSELSPRWWTLTDEITPEELRSIHRDTDLHRERYAQAVEAEAREPLSKRAAADVTFYVNGKTHPELIQMWSAFDAFALGFGIEEVDPVDRLSKYGFEGEVLETIVEFGSEYFEERERRMEAYQGQMKEVLEMVETSRQALGEKSVRAASQSQDAAIFAQATGYSLERVNELLDVWKATPHEDFAAESLPVLKEELDPVSWERFRSYLLEVQAPRMAGTSTDPQGGA